MSTDRSGGDRTKILDLLVTYDGVVSEMAKKYGTLLVKTQEAFEKQLKYRQVDYFCAEPVHPYHSGHTLIALEILKKLGW